MKRQHRRATALAALAALGALASPVAGGAVGATRAPAGPVEVARSSEGAATPIRHVLIIYQENHTFDDTLGEVCQTRRTPCNGYVGPVTMADGVTAPNNVQPDVIPYVLHNPPAQALGIENKWDQIDGCTTAPYPCVSHVDPARIPNLVALADSFAVSDATFAAGRSASFGAHVTLAAGLFDGFLGFNPVLSKTGHQPGPGWGCPSFRDDLWGATGDHQYVPSCIPDVHGRGPYRASPVQYHPTIMERMEAAGLTWHVYQGSHVSAPEDTTYSFCTYFNWCLRNRFTLSYDSGTSDFLAAARSGTLPNLSIFIPMGGVSQHNGTSMAAGDNYIGTMVQAVEDSPEWDSTAVFITYDDCGCFYDHVKPPGSLGLRNPMVIVSPWVKPQSTDSTTAVQPYSMLAFVQHTFGLAPLSGQVSDAYDYSGSFNYQQRPLPGVPMTRATISKQEQARVDRLVPRVARDPA